MLEETRTIVTAVMIDTCIPIANAFVNIISPHRKTTQDNQSTAYLPLRKVFQS